jgi:hypothetical protein
MLTIFLKIKILKYFTLMIEYFFDVIANISGPKKIIRPAHHRHKKSSHRGHRKTEIPKIDWLARDFIMVRYYLMEGNVWQIME